MNKNLLNESLQKVDTHFFQNSESQEWKESFNDCTFFNYDPVNPLIISQWVLQPAVTIGGIAYPTYLEISLKVGCVNNTNFFIDTKASPTANWRIIYTQYLGIQ